MRWLQRLYVWITRRRAVCPRPRVLARRVFKLIRGQLQRRDEGRRPQKDGGVDLAVRLGCSHALWICAELLRGEYLPFNRRQERVRAIEASVLGKLAAGDSAALFEVLDGSEATGWLVHYVSVHQNVEGLNDELAQTANYEDMNL